MSMNSNEYETTLDCHVLVSLFRSVYCVTHWAVADRPVTLTPQCLFPLPAVHISPAQSHRCPQPLPGCVPSPLRRDQGAAHLPGEDQECQGGEAHVEALRHVYVFRSRRAIAPLDRTRWTAWRCKLASETSLPLDTRSVKGTVSGLAAISRCL